MSGAHIQGKRQPRHQEKGPSRLGRGLSELLAFRFLFSLIFIGLGGEHIFRDELIQQLMPDWIPAARAVSIFCGLFLVTGGGLIAVGYRLKLAAVMLGAFLVAVTILVHAPALAAARGPVADPADQWIWDTLQRSNFVKNLCLLGVCLMLPHYRLGEWSLESLLAKKNRSAGQRR